MANALKPLIKLSAFAELNFWSFELEIIWIQILCSLTKRFRLVFISTVCKKWTEKKKKKKEKKKISDWAPVHASYIALFCFDRNKARWIFYLFLKHPIMQILPVFYLQDKLVKFILACQDEETGGFADRPGDVVSIEGNGFASRRAVSVNIFCLFVSQGLLLKVVILWQYGRQNTKYIQFP